MRTRGVLASLVLAAIAWPASIQAQSITRAPVVGILWHAANEAEEEPYRRPLLEGFARLGYVSGRGITFEERYANETLDLFDRYAKELSGRSIDVLVAVGNAAALAAQRATTTMPIVFCPVSDPVGMKLVASLARPGGNITGRSAMLPGMMAKRMQVLKDAIPTASRVALLADSSLPLDRARTIEEVQSAARRLELSVETFDAGTAAEIDQAIAAIASSRPDVMIVSQTSLFFAEKDRIGRLAVDHRLPSMTPTGLFAEAGALLSYGAAWPVLFRSCAAYVDRILKGDKPGDIPVEQPTQFELVINMKTAKALGLKLPASILVLAERLIED